MREAERQGGRSRFQLFLGVTALTWVLVDGLFAIAVVIIRQYVSGQVGLQGLENISAADLENLRSVEFLVGPGIVVACSVGAKASDDLTFGYVEWWWSVALPVLIGLWVWCTLYHWGYAGALMGSD